MPREQACQNITEEQLQKIKHLNLSYNGLFVLSRKDLAGLINLKILNLSDNRLRSFTKEVLADLANLEYIDLSSNDLNSFPEGFLSPCPSSLEYINLSFNDLTSLPEGFLSDCTGLRVSSDWMEQDHFFQFPEISHR